MTITHADLAALDRHDPLAGFRDAFQLEAGLVYLDGNSLGPLLKSVARRVTEVVANEWGQGLIRSWNLHDWIELPQRIGDKIAPLIGAKPGEVIVADSTSVNLFKLLAAGLSLQPERTVVLSARDNFPTDLYMAEGLAGLIGSERCSLRLSDPENLLDAIDERTAMVMLTHVDFRSGRMFDMQAVTRAAHESGALVVWDLAHSAGAVPVNLNECDVDMAVGCGYKFLNGGPGAPAFVFVAERHQPVVQQPLSGWMGHDDPFAFSSGYAPAAGMKRFLSGTPAVIGHAALDSAMDLWQQVDVGQVREKSLRLGDCLIELMENEPALGGFELASPRSGNLRGSQVSFAHPDGYAIMQALIDDLVIGDFRAPDLLRFGLTPLYTRYVDIGEAVSRLADIMTSKRHRQPRYQLRNTVT